MKNYYKLGIAVILWKSGGHSQAVISNDHEGNRMIHCANWVHTNLVKLSDYEHDILFVITDIDDICKFLQREQNNG